MVEVVCGVIDDGQGRFLACQRPLGKHLGGLWEFPGGKVDPGETPQLALERELMEELGIRVEVGLALKPVIWAYEGTTIRLSPFRCTITSGEPRTIEHQRIRWCTPSEFTSLQWAEADLPILDELQINP